MSDLQIQLTVAESALVNEYLSKCDGMVVAYKQGVEASKSLFIQYLIKFKQMQQAEAQAAPALSQEITNG